MIFNSIFKKYMLKERKGMNTGPAGGRFFYRKDNRKIEFQWDAAGIDTSNKLVLMEDEGSISNLHIHGHLARIPLMISMGEEISKIVWVVDIEKYESLFEIIDSYTNFFSSTFHFNFPKMEFFTKNGEKIIDKRF
jgi:hypothetical protein